MHPDEHLPLAPSSSTSCWRSATATSMATASCATWPIDSAGTVTLHAGTLYRTLARLLDLGFIEELAERPASDVDDRCRRY